MLNKRGASGGVSGRRSLGAGEPKIGEVKAIRNAPGGVDRRVDVVIKDPGSTKREKASVYMHRKNTKELKTGKKYEFELEKREIDKERGSGTNRMGRSRKTYRCETPPVEQVAGGQTFKSFSSKDKKLGKWHHAN